MSAVLEKPTAPAPRTIQGPVRGFEPDGEIPLGQVVQVLAGGGLLLAGVLRRSGFGLAMAALGCFLLYRSLRQLPRRPSGLPGGTPDQPSTGPVLLPSSEALEETAPPRDEGQETHPVQPPPPLAAIEEVVVEDVVPAEAPPVPVEVVVAGDPATVAGLLTEQELAWAEEEAYFKALERGGGTLPPYDAAQANTDFCAAARRILMRRSV